MGHQPHSAAWYDRGGQQFHTSRRLTDEQCQFLNDNVGISRRTLRHVHVMLNEKYGLALSWDEFQSIRARAIMEGRCRTTYFRHYYKNENSSERELRLQRPFLNSRITGGCQYRPDGYGTACGAPTVGRFCETHVHAAFDEKPPGRMGLRNIGRSMGKYG